MSGGISRYVQNVSKELGNLGVDITVLTLRPSGCPSFEQMRNVQIYRVLSGSDLSVNLFILGVRRYLKTIKRKKEIDIIHGQLPLIQSVFLPKSSTPMVETIHSVSKIEIDALKNLNFSEIAAWEKYLIVFGSIYRVLEKIVFTKADVCIAVSNHVKEEVEEEFNHGLSRRIVVIPNGVDPSIFHSNVDGQTIRTKLGTNNEFIIGFLGRLCGRKNIKTLIRAFSDVVKVYSDVKLAIGGSGDPGYVNQLVDLARQHNISHKIVFLGYIPDEDVPRFYAACDMIVVPSFQESFGITILEGMASKKPIAAANAGGIVEFVKDGVNGVLFNPKNHVELANAILKVKDDEKFARTISSRARKMAETKYSWNSVAHRIIKVYDKMI